MRLTAAGERAQRLAIEIAFRGRGGQGVKTAGDVLTDALYRAGMNPHGQPRYTADRMGAPVSYAIRFNQDQSHVLDRSFVRNPEMVVLFDLSLMEQLNLLPTWRPGITLLVNCPRWEASLDVLSRFRLWRVDANRVAKECGLMKGSVPILSSAMCGAFVRASSLIELDSLLEALEENLQQGATRALIEPNLLAARRGYAMVRRAG